jgi:hypothetical protein
VVVLINQDNQYLFCTKIGCFGHVLSTIYGVKWITLHAHLA